MGTVLKLPTLIINLFIVCAIRFFRSHVDKNLSSFVADVNGDNAAPRFQEFVV